MLVSFLKTTLPAAALLLVLSLNSSTALAQQIAEEPAIELVSPDGEPLEQQFGAMPGISPDDQGPQEGSILPGTMADGKVTFTDQDGTKRELNLSNAQSVMMRRSTKVVKNNGERETVMLSTATIVDQDGKKYEIELEGAGVGNLGVGANDNLLPGGVALPQRRGSTFMIGVRCVPVPAALQAQLGLEEGTGLLVAMVGEGSPADAAGLQQHDILLFSDDTQLLTNADLVAAVENAGQNSKPVSLTVMRGGQEIGIEVTPAERSTQPMAGRLPRMPDLGLGGGFGLGQLGGDFGDFEIESFGPNEVGVDFEQAIEGLRQQMQRARERQQQLFDRMQQR